MQESLFAKKAVAAAQPAPLRVEGVSKVLDYVRRLIAANRNLASIKVRGEVSGLTNSNGTLRFKLKEEKDILECIVWANDAAKLAPFREGDEIVCAGDFSVYTARSAFQLIVKGIELSGAGAIYAQLKALEDQFRKEGLFEESRKRPMPAFPRRVAVISARDGRGMNDFLTTLARRAPFIDVTFIETRVQGDGAEMDIGAAIDRASKLDVDVILLTRGGGSVEDLYPFNKEPVVRAIVRSKHPVMTAIGHNLDIHVSDRVADFKCETPSNAAQYFGEIGDRFTARLERLRTQMDRSVRERWTGGAQHFDTLMRNLGHAAEVFVPRRSQTLMQLERRLSSQTPQERVTKRRELAASLRSRLDMLAAQATRSRDERLVQLRRRFEQSAPGALRGSRQRLDILCAQLKGVNPEAPLERGYAIVTLDGKAVRDAGAVPPGATIEARVQRGRLRARVEETQSDG
jgi:exodeoxyribonuclease VII large subunit